MVWDFLLCDVLWLKYCIKSSRLCSKAKLHDGVMWWLGSMRSHWEGAIGKTMLVNTQTPIDLL